MPCKINMLWSIDDWKWRPTLLSVFYLIKSCRSLLLLHWAFWCTRNKELLKCPKFYISAAGYFSLGLTASRNVTKWLADLHSPTWGPITLGQVPFSHVILLPAVAGVEQEHRDNEREARGCPARQEQAQRDSNRNAASLFVAFKCCGKGLKLVT